MCFEEYFSSRWISDRFTASLGPADVPLDLGEGRFSFHLAINKTHVSRPLKNGWNIGSGLPRGDLTPCSPYVLLHFHHY